MERTQIKNIKEKIGQDVLVSGFVQAIRDQGGIKFLILRDITGIIQVVVLKSEKEVFEFVKELTLESVISVKGLIKEEKQAPEGFEIKASEVIMLSKAEPELPIPVVSKGDEETEQSTRLDWRWIDLRKPEKALVFKVWTTLENAFRTFLINKSFLEIHSPKTTITATETSAELFEVKYFDQKAFLAQSPQLYKQMAMASGFEKVFEVGPVFRANPSFTSRHDTEFTMYDIEMSFIESHEDLLKLEEEMMAYILTQIKQNHGEDIKKYYNLDVEIPSLPFPRITLREAKEILKKLGIPNERGEDLSPLEERSICEYAKKEFNNDFVFIHEWPASVRAFYAARLESDKTLTQSFDLLYRGIEITSGAKREHRPDILEGQIKEKGLNVEGFKAYIDFFRYGCPPHGGFAPGPSRIIMKILGLDNVREATYLYRGVHRLTP